MRWGRTSEEIGRDNAARHERLMNWHRAFALVPHRTDLGWVWLEWAERKGNWIDGGADSGDSIYFDWRTL